MTGPEVIVSKLWKHKNGLTASVHGAVPWTNAPGDKKEDWSMVEVGFTIRWPDGTVGTGRPPFATREAAERYAEEHKRFPGLNQG